MSAFISRGPLPPDSPLFRGRTAELARLSRLCLGELQAYAIIYGGRQTGKTSLALRLLAQLVAPTFSCRVDFQELPGAGAAQVYAHLARRVGEAVALSDAHATAADRAILLGVADTVNDAPGLTGFLCQALNQPWIQRWVLVLEELGALPSATRHALANVLRALFSSRFDATHRPLAKLVVILTGSVELYDLAVTEVSTLYNICEDLYLPDLSETDAVALVAGGLAAGRLAADATALGQEVYAWVRGHPSLTQHLGSLLEERGLAGEPLTPECVATMAERLLRGDGLLRHLRRALNEQQLCAAAQTLLAERLRFSRLDEELARLELLGLAAEREGYWAVRNPLLERALRTWVGSRP